MDLSTTGKPCGFSCIRLIKELWLLAVRLICSIGLFLSLFGPKNVGKCVRWVRNGLTDTGKLQISRRYRQSKRKQRIVNITGYIIGGGLVVLFICIFRFLGNTDEL